MKLFFITSRIPYPIEKGDKLRAFYQLKFLHQRGYEIILCALSNKTIHPDAERILSQYCHKVIFLKLSRVQLLCRLVFTYIFTNKSLQVNYFYNKGIKNKIVGLLDKTKPDHIYCQLIRVSEYVKNSSIPKTLDYMDTLSRGMERQVKTSPFYIKPFLKVEAIRLKRYEHQIFDFFDNHCIISEQDKSLITHINFNDIAVIPNGIDFNRFKADNRVEKKYDILFTGNMSYPPNIDAALFLITQIMPIVWKQESKVKVMISGAKPTKALLKYKNHPNVIISGWVSDLSEIYNQSRIFVAPMQIGTGLQNKLLEAMAMKLPCITSPLANNALKAKDKKEILIAASAEDYAKTILKLIDDQSLREMLGSNGYQYVKNNFSWEESVEKLSTLFQQEKY